MAAPRRRSLRLLALGPVVGLLAAAGPVLRTSPPTPDVTAQTNPACNHLDDRACLLPFPSNHFTTGTGHALRVRLPADGTPRNLAGKPVDVAEQNRNDGFSPGQALLASAPGLDLAVTFGIADRADGFRDQITDLALSLAPDAPIVVLDAVTGERMPYVAELDTHVDAVAAGEQLLIVRPAANWREGRRYLVALRDLRDASGALLTPDATFTAIRDGGALGIEDTFAQSQQEPTAGHVVELEAFGIDRASLFLAWDFSVATNPVTLPDGTSSHPTEDAQAASIGGRALHLRDTTFAGLGDTNLADGIVAGDAPRITLTDVQVRGGEGDDTALRVHGHVEVPNFLTLPQNDVNTPPPALTDPLAALLPDPLGGGVDDVAGLSQMPPGSRFFHRQDPVAGADVLPSVNPALPTLRAEFDCQLPATASPVDPAVPMLYGHGLLGGRGEAGGSSSERMREANFLPCGVDWIGMATEDVANVATILTDMGNFASLTDRAQQGFLNFLVVGRALAHPAGMVDAVAPDGSHPFRLGGAADGAPLVGTDLVYDGNSQGGIMGGALTALAPDFTRAVLGVPGANYSTLLNRSVDWEGHAGDGPTSGGEVGLPAYATFMYSAYPDVVDRQIVFQLVQMLWDRAEANGFAAHATDQPLHNTPAHQVLLHPALGDYQVANLAAEVQARAGGMATLPSALAPGRHWSVDPSFGMPDLTASSEPFRGSALVYFDSGNPLPPNGNTPPASLGQDPHSDPRKDPRAAIQKDIFLRTGVIVDVNDGAPNRTDRFPRG